MDIKNRTESVKSRFESQAENVSIGLIQSTINKKTYLYL